ncbi:hypothetical protein K490DRAFT_72874 [Saccharata proteae CBS 121410]|uniref:Ornithine decarboxylase antizyme n=1 Tax=Saccharata proteae CBS 121410 TaxID=1314787 RepID=A0A9P4LY58_9PEZI|nr:hypothetical protein K490DRAFT_72874 [Saccharata proteae CBS 121410]
MAKRTNSPQSSSSSSRFAMKASCYAVDASSMALQGFHYSTTGAGGADPPLAAYITSEEQSTPRKLVPARRGGAACTIAGECERLFCETLKTVFLGEGNQDCQDSLAMGMYNINDTDATTAKRFESYDSGIGLPTPPAMTSGLNGPAVHDGLVQQWIEVWDYAGGARFRGFVAGEDEDKSMFVFFDEAAMVKDLKPGLMALIELCSISEFDCTRLNVCLDRATETEEMNGLMKDLGWIGFEPVTLAEWTSQPPIISDQWVFLGMEV